MAYICELQATLKDRQCNNEQTEKTPRQPTLRKIKRGVLPTHLPTQKHHIKFCPTAPKAHPPPDQWTVDTLTATFDINGL
jgi:hypothetical protein